MKCRVNGCTTEHGNAQLCCKRHWFKLPKAVRDDIWRLFRDGPEDHHREACFAALASLEGMATDVSRDTSQAGVARRRFSMGRK